MAPMAVSPQLNLGSASTTYVSEEAARRVDHLVRVMFDRLDLYQETSLVLGYLPVGEEIDTIPIMREVLLSGKRLALPWLDTRASRMYFYEVDNLSSVTRGSRGLAAPPFDNDGPLTNLDFAGSLCLVPGIAFDGEGYRIGYGAGYYDEFLAFYPGNKVGLVRSMQRHLSPLPHNEHDIPVDVLVSEGSIWRCRAI